MNRTLSRLRRTLGATALALGALMMVAPQAASAATLGQSPYWFTPGINQVRFAGSETTYYMMTRLGDLYNQTSIFGCTLNSTDLRTCNTAADTNDTDTLDDYSRNEITQGAGIGSANGIGQLCGSSPTGGLPVDVARASRPLKSTECSGQAVQLALGQDALYGLVWYHEQMPTGSRWGNVANGWRTGDDINCGNAAPPGGVAPPACSGQPFNNIDNSGGVAASIAGRIYCTVNTDPSAITDWGQLTDKTPDPANPTVTLGSEGKGAAIGVPIQIWGVQTGSGTYGVWKTYVGCDPNTKATPSTSRVIQENNGPQVVKVANAENPPPAGSTGPTAGAEELITQSLYYASSGVTSSNPYTKGGATGTKVNGAAIAGKPVAYPSAATSRTLYNVYLPKSSTVVGASKLRGSTAGFLNWISTTSTDMAKGTDLTTGKNYQSEIDNVIGTQFGFWRLTSPLIPAADVNDPNS